jgi:hypothetical protein
LLKLSNRFFGALAGVRFFFGFRPRLFGIGKQGGLARISSVADKLFASRSAVQRLLAAMVTSTSLCRPAVTVAAGAPVPALAAKAAIVFVSIWEWHRS